MNTEVCTKSKVPVLIEGKLHIDDRGEVTFINGFDMTSIRRFYTIKNHRAGFIRAWHGHKKEAKFITVVEGAAVIAGVEIDNWDNPSRDSKVHRFILSAKKPAAIFIPEGYANGFMTLTEDTRLIIFSNKTVEDSLKDDFRYDAYYWNPWEIAER